MKEFIVCKYRFNNANKLWDFIREFFIDEDQLTYIIGGELKEVKEFYRYDVKSASGNVLHQLYTIDASLFD